MQMTVTTTVTRVPTIFWY